MGRNADSGAAAHKDHVPWRRRSASLRTAEGARTSSSCKSPSIQRPVMTGSPDTSLSNVTWDVTRSVTRAAQGGYDPGLATLPRRAGPWSTSQSP